MSESSHRTHKASIMLTDVSAGRERENIPPPYVHITPFFTSGAPGATR